MDNENINQDEGINLDSLTNDAQKYLDSISQLENLSLDDILKGCTTQSISTEITQSVFIQQPNQELSASTPISSSHNEYIETFNKLSSLPILTQDPTASIKLLDVNVDASGSVNIPFIRELNLDSRLSPEEIELFQIARQNLHGEFTSVNRVLALLARKYFELEHKYSKKAVQLISEKMQLPFSVVNKEESAGLILKPKQNRGYRVKGLTREEILLAKKQSPSINRQAEYLGVSRTKYDKYCKIYGLYTPFAHKRLSRRKFVKPETGRLPLTKILNNECPKVRDFIAKHKLLIANKLYPACSICGYEKRRPKDNKICLLLDHIDNNKKNFSLDNLRLICYNCAFEYNRECVCSRKPFQFEPDWLQGSFQHELQEKYLW